MENYNLEEILVERGYSKKQAHLAISEIAKLNDSLKPLLEKWLENPNNMDDYVVGEISLLDLKKQKKMNYLGALLTIDWLIAEPDVAHPVVMKLLKGIHLE